MPAFQARAAVFLSALWWGSLSGLGFVVVPLLFKYLGTPAEAGAMAAKLFSAQTWLSVACTMLLLLMLNRKNVEYAQSDDEARKITAWVVVGLLLTLLVEFGVAAQIVNARSTVTPEMAVRLELAFGKSAESWLAHQAAHDLWVV